MYDKACIKCKSVNIERILKNMGWIWKCKDCGKESLNANRVFREEVIIYDYK